MGIYLKSILAGVVVAIAACVASLALTIAFALGRLEMDLHSTQSGGLGAVSVGWTEAGVEIAAPVGFALGFVWMFRRLRRRVRNAAA
jgi:hypothetical protein